MEVFNIIIIVIGAIIAIAIGITLVCCCCCKNSAIVKEEIRTHDRINCTENGSSFILNENQDFSNKYKSRKFTNETEPLRNEPKKTKITVDDGEKSKSFILNENQDFSNKYKSRKRSRSRNKSSHIVQKDSTLFVEKLDKKIPTPNPLFSKHVVNRDITDERAIGLRSSLSQYRL